MRPSVLVLPLLLAGCITTGQPCGASSSGAELRVVGEQVREAWLERGQQGTQHLIMSMVLPDDVVALTPDGEPLVDRARIEANLWEPSSIWGEWDVGGAIVREDEALVTGELPFILVDAEQVIGRKVCVTMTVEPVASAQRVVAHELLTVAWMPGHEDGLPTRDSGGPMDTAVR